ncbi:MAG: serine hydrolase [Candidatus Acidiferrales bacterium]
MTAGPKESPAKGDVEKLIRQSGANISIAFRALDGSQELFIQADKPYHAASTMKIPVMIELYAQAQAGQLKLSDPIMVHNSFRSIVDGSIYRLDPSDDSDEDVYKAIGGTMTLQDLCAHMITRSSNLAANLLIERLGVDKIREQIDALHANGMDFLRGVEDGKAFEKGRNNMTTARALLNLLWALAKGEAVDPAASEAMVGVLARSEFHEAIPAGLPEGTRIAHKTGEITGIHHDASIVYGPHPFILVIMVEGITDREKSSQVMALIAHSLASALQ